MAKADLTFCSRLHHVQIKETPQLSIHFQGKKSTPSENEVAQDTLNCSNGSPLSEREAPTFHTRIFPFSSLLPHVDVASILPTHWMMLRASTTPRLGRKWKLPSFPPSQKEIMDYSPVVQQAKQDQRVRWAAAPLQRRQRVRGEKNWQQVREYVWKILPFHGSSDVPVITPQTWPWNDYLWSCFYFVAYTAKSGNQFAAMGTLRF